MQEFLPLGFWIPTIQGSEPVRFVHLSPGGILFRRPSTQSGQDWQCQSTVEQATARGAVVKTCTIKRSVNGWFSTLTFENIPLPLPPNNFTVTNSVVHTTFSLSPLGTH